MCRCISCFYLYLLVIYFITISINCCHSDNVQLSQILEHVDVNLSACLNIVILPASQLNIKFSFVNHQHSWILMSSSSLKFLDSQGSNIADLTLINDWKVTEGCRLIFDLSERNIGEVSPIDWKRQSVKAFTYEIFYVANLSQIRSPSTSIRFPYIRIFTFSKNDSTTFLQIFMSCGDQTHSRLVEIRNTKDVVISSPISVNRYCIVIQNGRGQPAYFESDASLTVEYLLTNKPECEHRSYMSLSLEHMCTYSEVTVRIIASKINVTFTSNSQIGSFHEEEELSDFDSDPAIVFNVEKPFISSELLLEGRSRYLIMNQFHCFILYCTHSSVYGNPSWLILLEPFDQFIWLGIVCTGIFYAFAYKSLIMGFDVIIIFLGQIPQAKHSWNRYSLAFTVLGLLLLNIYYGSEETTKVTAPLPKKQIKFAKEIFKLGYRTVVPDIQTARLGSMLVKNRYLKLGIPWDPEKTPSSVITSEININKPMQWWWFIKMANKKLVLPFPDQSPLDFGQKGLLSQNKIHNVSCFLIRNYERAEDDQHIFKRTNYYMTRGRLADKAIGVASSILEGGIPIIWKRVGAAQQLKKSQIKKSCRISSSCEQESYVPLKFHSPVQIVFYWHLIFCAVSCVAFMREVSILTFIDKNRVQTIQKV